MITATSHKREPETFVELLHARFWGRDKSIQLHDKLEYQNLLREEGALVPDTYHIFDDPSSINLSRLPDEFVLKPNALTSSRGIMILHRIAGGYGWWCSFTKQQYYQYQIRAIYTKWSDDYRERRGKILKIIAEEIVKGNRRANETPLDYKFYTFNGTVKLIVQIDRNISPVGICFYNKDFELWDWEKYISTNEEKVQKVKPEIPKNADEMLTLASRISKRIGNPFVSVDMYDSTKGPMIGELTRAPGGPYYGSMFKLRSDYDKELYLAWTQASKVLGIPPVPVFVNETIPRRKERSISSRPLK